VGKSGKRQTGFGGATPAFLLRGSAFNPPATDARTLQRDLGAQLRAMYDQLLDEPVPARFDELLRQFDQARQDERG
jgi:Anti-sigma factor NepR